jgi:hypothetical protein
MKTMYEKEAAAYIECPTTYIAYSISDGTGRFSIL